MNVRNDQRGVTLIEFMIAVFLGLLVVIALGRIVIANQRSWEWGREKIVLQQDATQSLEWMARWVRAARTLAVTDSSEFKTYDETGALVHTYRRVVVGGVGRLQEDGVDMSDRPCTRFYVEPNADTTGVTLTLEFLDRAGNQVAATTNAALRNQSFQF